MNFLLVFLLIISSFQIECKSLEQIFTDIFEKHSWGGGKETVSGSGSTLVQTTGIRKILPTLFRQLNIKVILDAACGDFNWMSKVVADSDLEQYIGVDIVRGLIQQNNERHGKENIQFYQKDISKDTLPDADLIICRDIFLHLKFNDAFKIIQNFKNTKAHFLLISTYANAQVNKDRSEVNAGYRPINLQLPPFNFPEPLLLIENFKSAGKYLGLWTIKDIPEPYTQLN